MSPAALGSALRAAREAWQRGASADAEAKCRALLADLPDNAGAWTLLGIVLRRSDPVAAEGALQRALQSEPDNADAAFHLGNLYREQQRSSEAIVAYGRALIATPDHPSVLNNLALTHEATGDTERALQGYQAVLNRQPRHREALGNLVHLLCRIRRYEHAAVTAQQYLDNFPHGDARLWTDYGICQHHSGDYAGAEASLRRSLALEPGDPVAMTNLGSVLIDREDFEQADVVLSQAVAAGLQSAYAFGSLAYCRAQLCAWPGLEVLHARLRDRLAAGDVAMNAFAALSMPLTGEEHLRIARRWADDLVTPAVTIDMRATSAHAGSRLRLGYVSSDFRTHPTTFLLAEVWERHNRDRVETFAYSIGPTEASPLRSRVESAFDHFRECASDTIEQTVRRIRADGIDMLIDLNGYTTHARSEIFAARPAPLQLQWLGHLGTLGAAQIDYVITDRFATPEEAQPYFSERLLYLPNCYCPSDTRRIIAPQRTTREQNGLPARGFVFCCFNNTYKILPPVFDVWMRLLAGVPDSVLWLSPARLTAAANLRREALTRGIDPDRLVFAPRIPMPHHLARHVHADLFLDTSPYNAGATANHALSVGLPILTYAGTAMASRVAASQLRAIGLDEMVTHSLAEYEAQALILAREPKVLAGIRQRLLDNRESHPLFDVRRFTSDLEDVLERTWRAHAAPLASA